MTDRHRMPLLVFVVAACGASADGEPSRTEESQPVGTEESQPAGTEGKERAGEGQTVARLDQGSLCLSGGDETTRFQVAFDACLSSSCEPVQSTTCAVSLVDGRIEVTSRLEYLVDASGNDCTTDCGAVPLATCGELRLPAGTYPIRHGSDSGEVVLPPSAPIELFGGASRLRDCSAAGE